MKPYNFGAEEYWDFAIGYKQDGKYSSMIVDGRDEEHAIKNLREQAGNEVEIILVREVFNSKDIINAAKELRDIAKGV